MKRVLITGVEGFTGRYVADLLARQGYEVHGTAHDGTSRDKTRTAVLHSADLRDAERLTSLVKAIKPDCIIHLAAIAFVAHGDIDSIYATNVVGTRNLFAAADRLSSPPRMLLASSANVYGNLVGGAISETATPDPVNDYAVSKLASEYVARLYRDRMAITIARPFNYTGVGQSLQFLVPKIVDHVKRKEAVIELGNIAVARDFSDVRDVASAYEALISNVEAIGQTYNICSGRAYSLDEVIRRIKRISGHDFAVRQNPAFMRQNEVDVLWGDRSKLAALTGEAPRFDLDETLAWMLGLSEAR